MKTQKIDTRFMQGNKDIDGIIFDVVCEKIGMQKAMEIDFDFDNAIYSNGFISAVEGGLTPDFSTIKESHIITNNPYEIVYHHVIVNDICYTVYFN